MVYNAWHKEECLVPGPDWDRHSGLLLVGTRSKTSHLPPARRTCSRKWPEETRTADITPENWRVPQEVQDTCLHGVLRVHVDSEGRMPSWPRPKN